MKALRIVAIFLAHGAWWAASADEQIDAGAAVPPTAKSVPKLATVHGETRRDDYDWLRDRTNREVIAHLESENAYATALLRPTEALRESLYREKVARLKQDDFQVPYRLGGYLYSTRTEEGKAYPIHVRRKASPADAPEEVLLDLNTLAEGNSSLNWGAFVVSDDGNLLAYSIDLAGAREYTLHVKDLRTGRLLPDTAARVGDVAWDSDNATLYYVTEDAATKRPRRAHRHRLGVPRDEPVYEETDAHYDLSLRRTKDRAYLMLTSASRTTTEVRALPCAMPGAAPRPILPREEGHKYHADHREGAFYLLTNKGAENYRVVVAPADDPAPSRWAELVPHNPAVLREELHLFARHAVIVEREGGLPHLRVLDLRTRASHRVEFPEPAYDVAPGPNPEADTATFRYRYTSLVTPRSVYDHDMDGRRSTLLKRTEVRGGYDPGRYRCERISATAADGTRVPISLVSRSDVPRDGTAPLLLEGYGAYGYSLPLAFDASRLSLLDRGVVCALAHVRGGREMGEAWYDRGRRMNKRNTFADFIACADHLVAAGYASRDRLAIVGSSAGGTLVAAVLNARPDLCRAAVLEVPFVDVINTMLDDSLPLTVQEYLEWGNPNVRAEYEYLKTYCPYTNIGAKAYPSILVTASLNDSQVMYWEPAKYVAKLRALRAGRNPILLRTNMAAGHAGSIGRYAALRESAFIDAFLLDRLRVTP